MGFSNVHRDGAVILVERETMGKHNQIVGKMGETLAREYLEAKGLSFVSANYRTSHGEIDLIFTEGSQRVFVEVKTRTTDDYGNGEVAVSHRKLSALFFAAETYLVDQNLPNDDWRIDVIVVERKTNKGNFEIVQFENVGLGEDYE